MVTNKADVKTFPKTLIRKGKDVLDISESKKINNFSKSGAYISVSGDYAGCYAYVVILRKGVRE